MCAFRPPSKNTRYSPGRIDLSPVLIGKDGQNWPIIPIEGVNRGVGMHRRALCAYPVPDALTERSPAADVAELADALDLGSSGATRAGSIPVIRIEPCTLRHRSKTPRTCVQHVFWAFWVVAETGSAAYEHPVTGIRLRRGPRRRTHRRSRTGRLGSGPRSDRRLRRGPRTPRHRRSPACPSARPSPRRCS